MKKKSLIGAAAGALAVTAALGSAAQAHPYIYDVAVNGSNATGTHKFFAISDGPIAFSVNNGSVITDMDCDSVNLEGEVYSGIGIDPVAKVKAVTRTNTPETFSHSEWKSCTGPFGLAMTVVPLNDWEIHPTGAATTGSDTNVAGYVSGPNDGPLQARVYSTVGGVSGSCSFIVEGYADGSFNEATQVLSVNETGYSGDLTIVNPPTGNCLGTVTGGSNANFVGDFIIGSDSVGNTKSGITQTLGINLSNRR